MIVLGVADGDGVVSGQPEFVQGSRKAGRLVDARGQNHHRPFVEDDLQLQPELTDELDGDHLMRLARRHDDVASRESGLRRRQQARLPKDGGGASANRRTAPVAGVNSTAPFSATTRSNRSRRLKSRDRSSSSRPVTITRRRPEALTRSSASIGLGATTPSWASVPS